MSKRPMKIVDPFYSSKAWRELREKIRGRWRAAGSPPCPICHQPITGMPVVDHIKDRKRHPGLALMEANLRVVCHPCNTRKGTWDDNSSKPETGADGFPKGGGWG